MRICDLGHTKFVSKHRARVLSSHLAALIPQNSHILDVGCGDGLIDKSLIMMRPDLSIQGIDVLVRDKINFPVKPFDGRQIPFQDSSFEFVVLIDVLHHLVDPSGLLREAIRVSSRAVLIKDHVLKGILAAPILRFMDRIGNLRYAVSLPYTYWPQQRWLRTFETLGVKLAWWNQSLGLYPWPANLVFERSLHFMARLDKDEPK